MIDEKGTLDLTGIKEINENSYYGNKKLKKLIIGNTLEKMGNCSFQLCINLEEIDFSNTILKEISYQCFYSCTSLKSIHLPMSIKFIGTFSFKNCHNLEYVILNGINEIGFNSFENCDSLKEFVFYEDIENLEEKEFFYGILVKQQIKITCPDKYIDYFKKRFPESEINNDYEYVLK